MSYALELNKVSKTYKKSGFILDQISFSLPQGSIMGIIGENGAGKTTTIGCILNTIFRDSGSIKIFGKEMQDEDTDIREKIGVVYDGDNFPLYYNATQVAAVMRGIYKNWDDQMYNRYLIRFGLDPKKKIGDYSRGMTMMLAIAVAISHHPQLLIMDEATSGLDPVMRDEILDIFLDYIEDENHSILLSSHITSDLEKIADYITFIHNGQVILSTEKDEIVYNYGIIRCREDQLNDFDKEDLVAWRKRDYQTDILVSDREKIFRKYGEVVMDHASIDEMMTILIKGVCA